MAPITDGESATDDGAETSLARSRSRRTRIDKKGRLAALERLKKIKESGQAHKYEVKEEYVYEEVDEEEYSKIVQKRQEDDWIVDDDGSGYVEDGREIFDEDEDEPPPENRGRIAGKERSKKNPNIRAPGSQPKTIRSMFAAAAVKPKKKIEHDVNLNEDNLLGDIMAELNQSTSASLIPAPVKLKKKKPAHNPFSTKSTPVKAFNKPLTSYNIKEEPMSTESTMAPPKTKKMKMPKMSKIKTELPDPDSEAIEEFVSQEVSGTHDSQKIEEDLSQPDDKEIDISGIDFDDDMNDEEIKENAENGKMAKKKEIKESASLIPDAVGTQWETIRGDTPQVHADIQVDSSKLPLTTNEDGEQVLRMYWIDAYEDHNKQPGIVYLFGKVWIESAKAFVSSCVKVKNIERRIYLLPRSKRFNLKTGQETDEPVTFIDIHKEFDEVIAEKYKIMKFKAMKVVKEYAFELPDIPAESEYLEIKYSADYPQLHSDLKGETFSHVFGTNTSSLELFLLDRKLKGPMWLDIKMPQIPNTTVSWCKVEAFVNKPDYVQVVKMASPPPPLVIMALNIRTVPNPKTHQNEVVAVSCLTHHKFYMDKPAPKQPFEQHFCTITKPSDCVFPFDFKEKVAKRSESMKIVVMENERAMLGFLLAKLHKVDPDLIVGHDIFGFDLDVILHRITQNKIPHWSRLGRLKRAVPPKMNAYGNKGNISANVTSGRLMCDIKICARELIRCRSYDLTELISQILREKRQEVDPDQIPTIFSNSDHLLKLVEWTLMDSTYILRLMYELNVIPLALQITNICGNIMARTLLGGRAERNEYLLLHAFTEKNFIVPDKAYGKKQQQIISELDDDTDQMVTQSGKKSGRRKPAYAGGLVLEPKKGFYDRFILLLDFNSLYPSIIQEYNICFTTVSRTNVNIEQDDVDGILGLELPDPDLEQGILPTEIRKLVESRRQVKQLMKSPDLSPEMYMQYDIRQKALKLTANSMYGCLGFTFSRFYAKPLAALITGKGREILLKTKDLVQNMNLDVIYGDTDSIMINTNCTDIEQVFKLGNKVKTEVNKLYKLLEIDIDGVFKTMLLLKKKKYAAISITKVGDKYVEHKELKGLDIVRRDWCELAKEAGNFVVSQILSGESRETILENIHSKLTEVGEKVKQGEIPVELYHITKALTKNPEDYPDKKSLPHVQVALRLNSKGGKKLRSGDTVYYVICQDGTNQPASQRAYHPDELAKRDDLKIDTTYYLSQQVHPVVARLCDPIDGTDAAHIAECLGLDPTGYRQAMAKQEYDENEAMLGAGQEVDDEKFKNCDRFTFSCPSCDRQIVFESVFTGTGKLVECTLAKCTNPECKVTPSEYLGRLKNHLTIVMRAHIRKYYEGWLKCEDSACNTKTRKMPLIFSRSHPVCSSCNKGILHTEYTDSALYNQLCFYMYIFDVERALKNISNPIEKDCAKICVRPYYDHYQKLKAHVSHVIKQSAYSEVNLSRLFHGLFSLK